MSICQVIDVKQVTLNILWKSAETMAVAAALRSTQQSVKLLIG